MEMSKGFVYTLEGVIASVLILSMVIFVLPETGPETSPDFSNVESGLETLEKNGSFEKDLTVNNVETAISPYVPSGFNHSVLVYKSQNNFSSAEAAEEIYINESGDSADIQFWIENPSGLNITFNGENLVQERNEPGYVEKNVPATEGWLNFTGSGTVDYSFNTYTRYGSFVDREEIFSKNSLTYHGRNREVNVQLWQ